MSEIGSDVIGWERYEDEGLHRSGPADRLASSPGVAAAEFPKDGKRDRNRRPSWLQIAQTGYGWFVIGINPDDDSGLDFLPIPNEFADPLQEDHTGVGFS